MSLVYLSLLYDYIFWFSSLNNPQVHVSFNHVKELERHWRNGQSSSFPAQQDILLQIRKENLILHQDTLYNRSQTIFICLKMSLFKYIVKKYPKIILIGHDVSTSH